MGKKNSTNPDQSAAMIAASQSSAAAQMHGSDNMTQVAMGQIGSQIMQSMGMFILGSSQIQSNLDLGHEKLENSLQVARMNYDLQSRGQEDDHLEKMEALRVQRAEVAMGPGIESSEFLT